MAAGGGSDGDLQGLPWSRRALEFEDMNGKLKTVFVGILLVIAVAWKLYRGWSDHQIPKSDWSITRLSDAQFAEKFTKVKWSGGGLEPL